MDDIENRTLRFTYSWLSDHNLNFSDSTILLNYRMVHLSTGVGSRTVENHLIENLKCKVRTSLREDYTKIIFESEEQLTEFLLKYG